MKMRKQIGSVLLLLLLSLLVGGGYYRLSRWADGDQGLSPATASNLFKMPTPELLPSAGSDALPSGPLATLIRFERSVKA